MTIKNPLHRLIRTKLIKLSLKNPSNNRLWVQKYLGSDKPTYAIKSADLIRLGRLVTENKLTSPAALFDLLDSLYQNGTTHEEIALAGRLLGHFSKFRRQIDLKRLEKWLGSTTGWAEIDILCQSNFTADEIVANFPGWCRLLTKFNRHSNISHRRASLVLLIKAVRHSSDPRIDTLAFANINNLKNEKHILITKAISWLLRALIKNHQGQVSAFIKDNHDILPKTTLREVTTKLLTGKKYSSGKKY